MPPQASEYLQHILDEIDYLTSTSRGMDRATFLSDDTLKRAFVRSIEVMGVAVKKISDQVREEHPEIEWRAIAGMRDRLIHSYLVLTTKLFGTLWFRKFSHSQKEFG